MIPSELLGMLSGFRPRAPAAGDALRSAEEALGALPRDFAEFMQTANGGEGFVGSTYIRVFRVEEIVTLNAAYRIARWAPGVVLFASNGGGDATGFDVEVEPWRIVRVPFVPITRDNVAELAASFSMLLEDMVRLAKPGTWHPAGETFGKEVIEVKPVVFGGDPVDRRNKAVVSIDQHVEYVNYWNELYVSVRNERAGP